MSYARRIACYFLLGSCSIAASAADAPRLEPGNWRLQVKSVTNGVADPPQDAQVCLREEELRDVARYFAPALEGVQAKCSIARQPPAAGETLAHRLRCAGKGFTYEARSSVTIEGPTRFRLKMHSDAKTAEQNGVVDMQAEAVRLGDCEKK